MSIGFFTRRSPGVLISRITNDVEALNQLVTDGVVTMFSSTLTLVGVVVILLFLDVKLALVTFLTFPLLAIASLVFRIVSAGAYRATRERIAAVTAYLQETLSGVRVVRSFGQEPRHEAVMTDLNEQNRAINMRTVYLNAAYFPAVEMLAAVGTAVILLYGGSQAIDGAIEIGTVVAFVGYLVTFFEPIQELSQLYTTYQQGMAALDKIFDLLETKPDMVDAAKAIDLGMLRGEIEMEGVSFAYAEDALAREQRGEQIEWALREVDLHVPPGQTLALVGATGAGKSTFAKLVARFYDPQKGRVRGRRITICAASSSGRCAASWGSSLRRDSSFLAACGRTSPSDARRQASRKSRTAIRTVGATDFVAALPGRHRDSGRGARGDAVGGVSANSSPLRGRFWPNRAILILDEATSNVDVRTEKTIERGLERLLSRAHRDCHRPSPLDNSPSRQDRRAGRRKDRRAGHPRGADRRRRAVLAPVRGMGAVLCRLASRGRTAGSTPATAAAARPPLLPPPEGAGAPSAPPALPGSGAASASGVAAGAAGVLVAGRWRLKKKSWSQRRRKCSTAALAHGALHCIF